MDAASTRLFLEYQYVRVSRGAAFGLHFGCTPRLAVDAPQVFRLDVEIPFEGLVCRVHRRPLDFLRRTEMPERLGGRMPRPTIEVHARDPQIRTRLVPPLPEVAFQKGLPSSMPEMPFTWRKKGRAGKGIHTPGKRLQELHILVQNRYEFVFFLLGVREEQIAVAVIDVPFLQGDQLTRADRDVSAEELDGDPDLRINLPTDLFHLL